MWYIRINSDCFIIAKSAESKYGVQWFRISDTGTVVELHNLMMYADFVSADELQKLVGKTSAYDFCVDAGFV